MYDVSCWVRTIRYLQILNWVTVVKCLSPMGVEVIPSLRPPTFAMLPLRTSHTFPEYRGIQSHPHTSLP